MSGTGQKSQHIGQSAFTQISSWQYLQSGIVSTFFPFSVARLQIRHGHPPNPALFLQQSQPLRISDIQAVSAVFFLETLQSIDVGTSGLLPRIRNAAHLSQCLQPCSFSVSFSAFTSQNPHSSHDSTVSEISHLNNSGYSFLNIAQYIDASVFLGMLFMVIPPPLASGATLLNGT